ncbi:FRIGIDA-like protein 3 [Trifolium pratense]|uniref:FRIGIDA-like protein 3 n=1 Tax=Trifolium pratense TaxID=57577 RepID=UPI001E693C09|nr:FRIGIDA-like protein 3 [Trifolium pratense]
MFLKKRPFDDTNSLHTSVKKSKESPLSMKIMKKSMLRLVEESIGECQRQRSVEEQKLNSIERDIEDCYKEILNKKKQASYVKRFNQYYKKMQNKIAEGVKDFAAKEAQVCLLEDLIKKHTDELEKNKIELRKVVDRNDKDGGGKKEEELETLSRKIDECSKEIKTKKEELDATKMFISGKVEELYSERSNLQKVMSKRKTDQCAQMKDFESTKKQVEGREKELESKQEEFEGRVREFESKKKYFKSQVKKLRSKEKLIERRVNELESEKNHFESQVEEFESKEKLFERRVHDLKLFKIHFESQLMELKSKEKQFEGRMKELESKEKHFEVRLKEFELKERHFEGRMREVKSKEEDFESRVREFESKEQQFKGRVREFEVKRLELQLKELKSKGNKFEGQVRDLESMQNNFDGQLKELELRDNEYEALIKSFEEELESDDQLSPTIDGRSFRLFPIEEFDELESDGNGVLVNLLASSSDPSKDVLDIIQYPLIPQCKGDNVVIIDECHIVLLEKLMRISPHVKPHVREEAMKLALNLKAYIGENTENSVPVLGFLLLLSIYGLVSSFDEDEVLKLFGFIAQHKIAVELFGTMGLAHKISDFVQNLIRKQQHIEAVRFICAYSMANKNQSVDLLREHMQNSKVISERSCKTTNSSEIKDKAIDHEIASLETVLRCISDNNIDSADLLDVIQGRILELNREKGK